MAPEMARLVRRVTFVLLALAAVAVEVAAGDTRPVAASLGMASIWIVVAVVVGRFVSLPANPRESPPTWVFVVLVGLGVTPFAVEPLRRSWTGDGYPLELQMVAGLRNIGLGLAACGGWLLCLRLSCVVSLFLILFAATMTNHPAVKVTLGLYTATGGVWLMLIYWTGLKGVLVSADRVVAVEVQPERQRVPWTGLLLLVLAVGCGLALALVGPKRVAFTLGELMPTSGGTGDTDPFARSGIGDGPEETAGDDAQSAGMVESNKMIEDNKHALIDAAGDMYGPPHKPPKEQERMVAAGMVEMIPFHGKLPDNRRPSREFDTSRKGPKGDKKPLSRDARALFEVSGRTPLHIRVVAYESYDSNANRLVNARKPVSQFIEAETDGGDWMKVSLVHESAGWYRNDEQHKLKSADLKDNLVPTPAMLTRFRINKVSKAHYYEWDYEGVLALAGRKKTPPGVVVTTECRTLDPGRLPDSAFGCVGVAGEMQAAIRPEIVQLASEWAGDRPRGWQQIDAILTKLRTEYTLDATATAPPNHPAPVAWFLTQSRRGPDYLFATAAAMLLRSLDYSSRVCLGYYAAPAAYDPETAHTPVTAADLHFWPEVRLSDGHWLVVEPTPGYEVLGPSLPLSDRIRNVLTSMVMWAWGHAGQLALAVAVLIVGWVRRRKLIDAVAVRLWERFPGRTWRDHVRRAVRILERRGRWAGTPRSNRRTVPTWLRGLPGTLVGNDADLDRLTRMAEWAAYAPDVPPPWPEADVRTVCRSVLIRLKMGVSS